MYFTKNDFEQIYKGLQALDIKDSQMQEADVPLSIRDTVSIVQQGQNKKINIQDFVSQLLSMITNDFINISARYNQYYISLDDAIQLISLQDRKEGLVITFKDTNGKWKTYQFTGVLNQFNNSNLWTLK